MSLFISADLHAGDERMQILGRPFRDATHCISTIHDNWNEIVKPDDTVIVNGDVAVDEKWLIWLKIMNGHKILVKGNYDKMPDEVYLKYFDAVYGDFLDMTLEGMDEKREKKELPVRIVHYPSKGIAEKLCLTGHVHATWRVQKNMINVGQDANHFKPLSVDDIFFLFRAIKEFYDEDVWVGNHPANVAHNDRGKAGTYWQTGFTGSRGAGDAK